MERDRGLGRPDQKPISQNNAYLKEQGSWQGESKECQPLPGHGKGQDEPANLNVSSANTVNAELPEAGLEDKPLRKLRRRQHSSIGGGRLHGYGEDDECPRAPENKNP
jgi:hypothetical protein